MIPHLHGENETQNLTLEKPAGEKPKTTFIRSWRDSLTGLGDGGGRGGWRAGVRAGTKNSQDKVGRRRAGVRRRGLGKEKKKGPGEKGGEEEGGGREEQKRQWVRELEEEEQGKDRREGRRGREKREGRRRRTKSRNKVSQLSAMQWLLSCCTSTHKNGCRHTNPYPKRGRKGQQEL